MEHPTVPIKIEYKDLKIQFTLLIPANGISGADLIQTLTDRTKQEVDKVAKQPIDPAIIRFSYAKQLISTSADRIYQLQANDVITFDLTGRPKESQTHPVDQKLVDLVTRWVANSSKCYYSIGSYLHKPTDLESSLKSQQFLKIVLDGLSKKEKICVILIDINFNGTEFYQSGSQQQIVTYLENHNYTVVDQGTQGDTSTFLVGGSVTIIYVGRNVYDETIKLLKKTGAEGGWYNELK